MILAVGEILKFVLRHLCLKTPPSERLFSRSRYDAIGGPQCRNRDIACLAAASRIR